MSLKDCCKTTGRDLVDKLFDEALGEVDKHAHDLARARIKSLLQQKQKTQLALAEIDRQIADLRIELKETL